MSALTGTYVKKPYGTLVESMHPKENMPHMHHHRREVLIVK